MVELVPFEERQPRGRGFRVVVEPESADGKAIDGDSHGIRFRYGPRSFASRAEAVSTARRWAEQYAVGKVYVH